jgi:DNA-binding transcriptional ArsR family regulator
MAASSGSREMRRERIAVSVDRAAHVAEVLKAVAHPLRIRLVAILCQREEHVNGLAEELGVPQAIVSQQLRILRLKNLVAATRADGFAHYRLAEPHLRDLVCCMERCGSRAGRAGA